MAQFNFHTNLDKAIIQIFNPSLILYNSVVRLRPIKEKDTDIIMQIATDVSIWKYFAATMKSPNDV